MTAQDKPGYSSLRRGRSSMPQASYFVTVCSRDMMAGLQNVPLVTAVYAEIDALDMDKSIRFRVGTIMPDHIHVLFDLGERLSVSQVVGRLKAKNPTRYE